MTKMGQMMQSRDKKNLNLDKDFEDIMSKVMKALQGVCMLTSVWARKCHYKHFLSDVDDKGWRGLPDDWQKYLSEKEESPRCQTEQIRQTDFEH